MEHHGHSANNKNSEHMNMGHDMASGGKKIAGHMHQDHHAHMVADFRRRFWVSLVVTVPVLLLSPLIQDLLGIADVIDFPGDSYVLWALSSVIFFYGGLPFLKGLYDELKSANPGMMTLIALAITVAYVYSSAVVFGLAGKVFFWEVVKGALFG